MELERKLVDYIYRTRYEDLPAEIRDLAKFYFLNILGTAAGGAATEKCEELVDQVREWGGQPESTILFHGGKVPAQNAAFVNSYMARALECDEGVRPGMHLGASSVPTAIAASEMAGGCSGKDFITALVMGAESAGRINFASKYNDFCPTGSCGVFSSAVITAKILGLSFDQIWNAMAIVYVRSGGGSPQSNRDGALSIRLNQGFVAQEGLMAARLAQHGLTGARNFLQGELGYFHLFSRDDYDPESVVGDLGKRFEFLKTMFKAYPSCGSTISGIEAVLCLVKEHPDITPENILKVTVKITPYSARLVDSPFVIGENPRVNAQYNVRYSIANALLRKDCRIEHYEEASARDPRVMELTRKIDIVGDAALEKRDETAVDIEVITRSGQTYIKGIDIAAGFPPRYLTDEQRMDRFLCNINYGRRHLPEGRVDKIIQLVNHLEEVPDVRAIVPLLLWKPENDHS